MLRPIFYSPEAARLGKRNRGMGKGEIEGGSLVPKVIYLMLPTGREREGREG